MRVRTCGGNRRGGGLTDEGEHGLLGVYCCYGFVFIIYLFSYFMEFGREKKLDQLS